MNQLCIFYNITFKIRTGNLRFQCHSFTICFKFSSQVNCPLKTVVLTLKKTFIANILRLEKK